MIRFAIAACLFILTGCEDVPRTWSESDIRSVARNEAEDLIDGVASDGQTNEDLERRVNELEQQIAFMKAAADRTAETRWTEESVDRLFRNDEAIVARVNWLLAQQGQPPIPKAN